MGPASKSLVPFIVFYICMTGTLSQSSFTNVTILSSKPSFGIVGQSKRIFCQVSGTMVSIVTWYFNGTPLNISSQYSWTQSVISGYADLVISSLLKSGSGTYSCSASNDAGTVSDSVILSAEEILNVTVSSETETGIVGQTKTLQCNIAGMPITSTQWSFNSNTLTNNELRYYWDISSATNFYIDSLTIADAGIYTCFAVNHAGIDSASIKLTVISRPVVMIENSTFLSAKQGETVRIPCVISNTTTIDSLQWYFQNKFLYRSDPHYFWSSVIGGSLPFDGSLRIYNVTSQDMGRYKCHATNIAGAGEDSTDLLISVPAGNFGSNTVEHLPVLAIILIVTGVLLVVSIIGIVILACCLYKYRKTREETQSQQKGEDKYCTT